MALHLVVKNAKQVSEAVALKAGQRYVVARGDSIKLADRVDVKVVRNGKNAIVRTAEGDEYVLENFYADEKSAIQASSQTLSWDDAEGRSLGVTSANVTEGNWVAANETGTTSDASSGAAVGGDQASVPSSGFAGLSGGAIAGLVGLGVLGIAAASGGGGGSSSSAPVDSVAPTAPAAPVVEPGIGSDINVGAIIDVSLAGTGAVVGDLVTVVVNGEKTNHIVTSGDISAGYVPVHVSLETVGVGPANVSAYITDVAGNVSVMSAPTGFTVVDGVAPVLNAATYNVAENTTAVATLAGVDLTAILYELAGTGADDAKFSLSPDGVLTLQAAKNFEAPGSAAMTNVYSIDVKMTDTSGNATTTTVTVNVTDVNEAPVSVGAVSTGLTAVVGATYSLDLSAYFNDPDTGAPNNTLVYSAAGLTNGLIIDSATGVISGTPTGPSATDAVLVTVTDSGAPGTTDATQSFSIDIVSAPSLSTALTGELNLDPTSNIVLTATEGVSFASTGTYTITISNLANGSGKDGYQSEATANTQVIAITDGVVSGDGSVSIVGNTIVINPTWDLDISNNYSLDISQGAFVGNVSGQPSVAFATANFATVTPGSGAALSAAVVSHVMDDATGGLVAGSQWMSVFGVGDPNGTATLPGGNYDLASDIGTADGNTSYTILLGVDSNPLGGDSVAFTDGVNINNGTEWVALTNFSSNDLIYVDTQVLDNVVNDFNQTVYNSTSSSAPTEIQLASSVGQAWVDVTLSGSGLSYGTLLEMQTASGSDVIISG